MASLNSSTSQVVAVGENDTVGEGDTVGGVETPQMLVDGLLAQIFSLIHENLV